MQIFSVTLPKSHCSLEIAEWNRFWLYRLSSSLMSLVVFWYFSESMTTSTSYKLLFWFKANRTVFLSCGSWGSKGSNQILYTYMVDPFLGAASVNFEKLFSPKALETHFQKLFALNEESTLIKYQYTDIDYGWKINFGRSIFSKSTQ